ncbi:Vitamin B12-binding protein [Hartmannibacter diazotrophicus]|uniref:Vitamin B12-binding protein n=1 Tax=Hartmannibacter diazotrophicus TaxID=1482074 RepID=A0A2C9D2U3_9HYPH|nr:ABC transporter substrate-binding protein [Hartmannibacter diazotrophicus]SON54584.1 Vitamin B12-binding protein [Hartmannibacter diazotrophicus]
MKLRRRDMSSLLLALPLGLLIAGGEGTARAGEAHPGAERIVSVGGAVTEILYALGAGERVVAVDTTSLYPPQATKLPQVGYMRQLAAEGVLSTGPDLILAEEGSGPATVLDILRESRVPVEIIPNDPTPEGIDEKIEAVGHAVGKNAEAKRLASAVADHFADLEKTVATVPDGERKRVLFVLSVAGGRIMAAGKDTAADAMIGLAGGINAADGFSGYKGMVDEAILTAAPDVILMMRRGEHAADAKETFAMPAFRTTPAAATNNLIAMDGNYLLGFGPRTPEAAYELASRLYPDRVAAR